MDKNRVGLMVHNDLSKMVDLRGIAGFLIELTYIEQLNIWVDHLAGKALLVGLEQHGYTSSFFHSNKLQSPSKKKKLTSPPKKTFEQYVGDREAKLFYHEKYKINRDNFKKFWWDGTEPALKRFPKYFRYG